MPRANMIFSWSILVVLLFACHSTKPVKDAPIGAFKVPHYLNTHQLAPVRQVNWSLGGDKVMTNENRQILVTRSGDFILKGKYFFNGRLDSVSYRVKALPPEDNCQVAIHTTKGTLIASLSDLAPQHSDHFERLVQREYYDSLTFHRIIPGFVVQGGDGNDTMYEDGVSLPLEELSPEFHPELLHYRGALAMARMPDDVNPQKNSSPDQFYLVHGGTMDDERLEELTALGPWRLKSYQRERYMNQGGTPQLDGEYTVFGYVTHGFDILDSLALTPTGAADYPLDTIYMKLRMVR